MNKMSSLQLLKDNTAEEPAFESRRCRPSHIIIVGHAG